MKTEQIIDYFQDQGFKGVEDFAQAFSLSIGDAKEILKVSEQVGVIFETRQEEYDIHEIISSKAKSDLEDFLKKFNELANKKIVKKIEGNQSWEELKKINEEEFKKTGHYIFHVNNSFKVKGKVTNLVKEYKQRVSLIKKCKTKAQGKWVEQIYHLDERIDKRYLGNIVDSFDLDLWLYQFISENRQYILLSVERLDLEEYNIEGVKIEVPDYGDIGSYFKIGLKFPMIFVHSAKKRIIEFKNHEEFFTRIKKIKLTKQGFRDYVFSFNKKKFKHPDYFENLILAFLLASKYDSSPYPLHIIIIGEPGGGKSKLEEALHQKFKEINEITDGTCSTMKLLIPSFKDAIPRTGDLLQANRICCIDEFFRILMRVEREERQNQLTFLNPLLEHKKRRFGSGNSSFEGQMTAKMLAVTNPIFGTKHIPSLCNKFDVSFLSRALIYYQDEEHYKKIKEISEDELEDIDYFMQTEDFIAAYDYLNSFQAHFDKKRVKEIYKSYIPSFERKTGYQEVLSMYLARYNHHICCLIDGIVKLRCLFEEDESFTAKEEDYIELIRIWEKILQNWEVDIVSKV